jgi:hypothetical protein
MTDTRTEWTVDEVAARFAEAAETARKLAPGQDRAATSTPG